MMRKICLKRGLANFNEYALELFINRFFTKQRPYPPDRQYYINNLKCMYMIACYYLLYNGGENVYHTEVFGFQSNNI